MTTTCTTCTNWEAGVRHSDGTFKHRTDLGCYPLLYLCADGGHLCPDCANGKNGSEASTASDTDAQWRLVDAGVYWEGPPIVCDHCGAEIASAYGNPDEPQQVNTIVKITAAYVRTYGDSGQTIAYVEWTDDAGTTGRTSGEPDNTHMVALLGRAEREGVQVVRDVWEARSK